MLLTAPARQACSPPPMSVQAPRAPAMLVLNCCERAPVAPLSSCTPAGSWTHPPLFRLPCDTLFRMKPVFSSRPLFAAPELSTRLKSNNKCKYCCLQENCVFINWAVLNNSRSTFLCTNKTNSLQQSIAPDAFGLRFSLQLSHETCGFAMTICKV